MQGSIAHFGIYAIDEAKGTISLRYDGSTYPNWTGTDQKRTNLTLSGDELKWTNPAPSAGGAPAVVVWKRAK